MKKFLFAMFLPLTMTAQVSMNVTGSYTQDFNTLAASGTNNPWTDNSTLPNWFCQKSTVGAVVYDAGTGTSTTGKAYSYGASLSSERALGTVGSGTIGNFAHGLLLQNTSGSFIDELSVSYTMEQWRNSGATTPQIMSFYYQRSASPISMLTPGVSTGWTPVTTLDASSPINGGTAGALNGNDPLNKVVVGTISIPILLGPGEYIMLKWDDPDHTGSDHGLSIDDVTVGWNVTCNTYNAITTNACGSYTVPSGDETYTADGIYFDTIPNTALCDSILTISVTIQSATQYFEDADNDLYGNPASSIMACSPPSGYVTNDQDCNDNDPAFHSPVTFYADGDGDGFGDVNDPGTDLCADPGAGYSLSNTDCDDTDETVYPGATDICDGLDNDCDGSFEEDATFSDYYTDADNDGYGTGTAIQFCANPGPGFSANDQDCDDTNGNIYPNATEIIDNGIDENCDGTDNYLAVTETDLIVFTCYPNPASDLIILQKGNDAELMIEILNIQGQVILSKTMSEKELILDLSGLGSGNYFLKASSDGGMRQIRISIL